MGLIGGWGMSLMKLLLGESDCVQAPWVSTTQANVCQASVGSDAAKSPAGGTGESG